MNNTTRLLLAIGKIRGVGIKTLNQISECDISYITGAGELLSYLHSESFPLKRKNIRELPLEAIKNALSMADATIEAGEKNKIEIITSFDSTL